MLGFSYLSRDTAGLWFRLTEDQLQPWEPGIHLLDSQALSAALGKRDDESAEILTSFGCSDPSFRVEFVRVWE